MVHELAESDTAEWLNGSFHVHTGPVSTLTNKTNRTLFTQSSGKKGRRKKRNEEVCAHRLLLIKGLDTCGGFFLIK